MRSPRTAKSSPPVKHDWSSKTCAKMRAQMHEYDTALKLLLQRASGLVARELGIHVKRWLNIELPKVQNPRVDLLAETTDGRLVHIEIQSTNDGQMALRMLEYGLLIFS